jgi:hypothetical protein
MITKRLATRRPHASDKLSDRHPYDPRDVDNIAAFASNVKGREVALAFKSRGPSKLVAALQRDDVSSFYQKLTASAKKHPQCFTNHISRATLTRRFTAAPR